VTKRSPNHGAWPLHGDLYSAAWRRGPLPFHAAARQANANDAGRPGLAWLPDSTEPCRRHGNLGNIARPAGMEPRGEVRFPWRVADRGSEIQVRCRPPDFIMSRTPDVDDRWTGMSRCGRLRPCVRLSLWLLWRYSLHARRRCVQIIADRHTAVRVSGSVDPTHKHLSPQPAPIQPIQQRITPGRAATQGLPGRVTIQPVQTRFGLQAIRHRHLRYPAPARGRNGRRLHTTGPINHLYPRHGLVMCSPLATLTSSQHVTILPHKVGRTGLTDHFRMPARYADHHRPRVIFRSRQRVMKEQRAAPAAC
jgi:hypothetical protein